MAIAFRRPLLTAVAVPAAVVAFYVWTAASTGSPFQRAGAQTGYYNLLTDGFLAGHLYLKLAPAPQLVALPDPFDLAANAPYRVNDLSLYRGRFYMYFGPVPVLTLFLPWRTITGTALPQDCAALIYIVAGYIFSLLLLSRLLRGGGVRPRALLWAAATAVLGMGQYGVVVLRDPGVYGVAIAAGFCFLMAGMYGFACLLAADSPGRALAVLSGLSIGLAPGCRPHYALAALILCAVYFYCRPRDAFWFCLPIAICAGLLFWYNYARFGNLFEFGTHYQLTGRAVTQGVFLRLRNLAPGLYYLLLCPFRLWDQFPFLIPKFVGPNPRMFVENATGLLVISPLAVAGLTLPLWRRRAPILMALYAGALAVLIFIALTGLAVGRYLLDFSPAFLVLSMFAWLAWAAPSQIRWRRAATAAIVLGSLWSIAVGAALSLGLNDILQDRNPRLFRTLARWSGQRAESIRLPVESLTMTARIRFPSEPAAPREALLVTGRPGAEDCLFVEYIAGHRLRFGYQKAVVGVTTGPPIVIAPDREYLLRIGYSGADDRLIISLDGAPAWNTPAAFYPTSQKEVALGRSAPGMPDIHPFSGVAADPRTTLSYP